MLCLHPSLLIVEGNDDKTFAIDDAASVVLHRASQACWELGEQRNQDEEQWKRYAKGSLVAHLEACVSSIVKDNKCRRKVTMGVGQRPECIPDWLMWKSPCDLDHKQLWLAVTKAMALQAAPQAADETMPGR